MTKSGIHGALVVHSIFNADFLLNSLDVSPHDLSIQQQQFNYNIKKILDEEIKILKKIKSDFKTDSVFLRPLASFRQQNTSNSNQHENKKSAFTFRVSLYIYIYIYIYVYTYHYFLYYLFNLKKKRAHWAEF